SHTAVAVLLGVILVAGILSNSLVLLLFVKYRSLWTPINLILLNINLSDILVCVFGTPFSFAASLQGRWLIGEGGCMWYGFANSLFGIVSLVSLSVLSYERCTVVLQPSQVDVSDFRKARFCVGGSWLYALLWTSPPLLGWSSYGPEGAGTTCSVQWQLRSPASVSYVLCLLVFCLLLPFLVMVYSYGRILVAIRRVGRINQLTAQRREQHILLMVLSMVSCYMLCWMPYGIMALVATFGKLGLVTPMVSVVPSILAKFSTVVNPIIYMFFNNQEKLSPEAKAAHLSMEKEITSRILARMIVKKKLHTENPTCKKFCHLEICNLKECKTKPPKSFNVSAANYLQWDIQHSFLRDIGYYHNVWLTVQQSGDYYVYSRVTFSKGDPRVPLASMIKMRKNETDKEEKTVMQAYCSLTDQSGTQIPQLCTATQGEVVTLESGNQLSVWVQDLSLVDYEEGATTFGMYKL
ncbi:unnamed protein product, partial [Tetraodon nigroviridis]